ncbi:MAG TPA: serine hydrolase domain-containing protein [Rhizomicrobium sp.]
MKPTHGLLAGALLLALAIPAFAADAPPPKTLADLDRALARFVADGKIPGAAVAIIENGRVVLAKGYGFADVAVKIPATADTPFRAGSISKSVTSIAVMTLVEQHRLALDAPLATLLPEVRFDNPWEKTDPVRLVNLLEHTTGWPDISTRVLAKDEKAWSTLQGVRFTMQEFVSRWKPGTFTVYNNAGPAVAGVAIEKASGRSFDDYTRDAILRPMGMAAADFDLPPDLARRIARSYGPDGSPTPYQYIVLKPAGSLNVSARELAQLARFYLGRGTVDGRRILSPESVARIERAQSNLGAKYGFHNSYALGNAVFPDAGITFRGHNGSIDSFTAVMGYSTRNNSGYVLMANGGEGVDFATPIAHAVQAYLARGLPLGAPPIAKVPQALLETYAGYYWTITPSNALTRPYTDILNINHVAAGDGKLVVSALAGLVGATAMVPVDAHGFRRLDRQDASLAFVEDGGRVYKIGAFNAQVNVPSWVVAAVFATLIAIVLGTVIGLFMLFVPGLLRLILKRPVAPGTWLLRLLPLASLAALVATFAMPFAAISDSGATAVRQISEIGPYSLTILLCSVLFPLLAVAGLVLSVRTGGVSRFVRAYAGLTSLALTVAGIYAASIGWFALRTWTM